MSEIILDLFDPTKVYTLTLPAIASQKAVIITDEPEPVSPEWLHRHGFEWLTMDNMPPAFDVDIRADNATVLILIEKDIHRNQFCVVVEETSYTDGSIWYDMTIWMQHNIGCGFIQIPDPIISEWTADRFQALYYALRGEKLEVML